MSQKRFRYEQSDWHCGESERWHEAFERMRPDNVRAVLYVTYANVGSRSAISVGPVLDITKGFAQEWLAWHDQQKAQWEAAFRERQIYWTRWAAFAATTAATAGVIGWILTISHSVPK